MQVANLHHVVVHQKALHYHARIDAELCRRNQLPFKITASPPKPASITFLEPVLSAPYFGDHLQGLYMFVNL
jgi:hypothetical protein